MAVDLTIGDSARLIELGLAHGVSRAQLAYILATAKWETAHTLKPVRETLATSDAEAVARLEAAWSEGRLSWVRTPYWRPDEEGHAWYGRGYVQLTLRRNYERASQMLGLDLLSDPNKVMEPEIAGEILVRGMLEGWFTDHALPEFVAGGRQDFVMARKVVNGLNRAETIAEIAQDYLQALQDEPAARPPATIRWVKSLLGRWFGRNGST